MRYPRICSVVGRDWHNLQSFITNSIEADLFDDKVHVPRYRSAFQA